MTKKTILILAVVILLGLGFFLLKNQFVSEEKKSDLGSELKINFSKEKSKGNPDADITIVEYVDFQCPACGMMQENWLRVWRIVKSDVRFVFRHYPLRQAHPNAQIAALYAEAAHLQGKFWPLHDLILKNQEEWSSLSNPREKFMKYAGQAGINLEQMKEDLEKRKDQLLMEIDQDIESGERLEVRGTPTIFINSQKIELPRNANQLLKTIKNRMVKH